jgi:hypothetical protein
MHEKEIEHLRSAVGKKRGKALRLGKKISAQDAIIHGLNEKLRTLRSAVDGLKKTNEGLRTTKGLVASMRAVCKDADGHDLYVHDFSKEFGIAAGDRMDAKIDLDGLAQFVRSVIFEIKTRPSPEPKREHDDMVDAMAYVMHPNCRCWNGPIHDSAKSDEATEWIERILGLAASDSEEGCVYVNVGQMPEITKEAIERMKGSLMRQMKGFAVYDERGVTPEFEDYATMCPDCGHVSGSGGCAECAANREAYEGDKADRGFDCPMG